MEKLLLIAIAVAIAAPLLILLYRYAIRGKFGNFTVGVGNALCQAHTFLRPTAQNVVQAKKQRREDAGQGDENPPELPPWAQSGH
jgi:hypothetical protein